MAVSFHLLDPAGWDHLGDILNYQQANLGLTDKILAQLRSLGAQTFVLEDEYVDRDFTDAFSAYYARLFKRHSKICKRLHFFKSNLDAALNSKTDEELASALESSEPDYVGFIVVRPVHEAPIASVVLRTPNPPVGHEAHSLVKAAYTTHLQGARLSVEALPMTQQDQRIGACAQAAIWSSARHFHARHRGPWLSMVNVTEAAMLQEVFSVSSTLPNGSEFLSISGMVSAFKSSGRKPLIYLADDTQNMTWQGVRPAEVINRYVDSGIPAIIGLGFKDQDVGHAVVASGQVFSHMPPAPERIPLRPTRAAYCSAFYVNDDQRGANLRMPVWKADTVGETPYSVEENVRFLIIPLPDKVFLPAEKAELLAWNLMQRYAASWEPLKASTQLGGSEGLGDDFVSEFGQNRILARTYLTYGWKYKHRMLRNKLPNAAKNHIVSKELPRYVWVTEFGTLQSFSPADKYQRRIFAHCVVDATAKNMGQDSCLFFHAPGVVVKRDHNSADPYGPYDQSTVAIIDDCEYYPKIRGEWDFSKYP